MSASRDHRSFAFMDFYIDVLGCLVPGLFTAVLATSSLAIAGSVFIQFIAAPSVPSEPMTRFMFFSQWLDFGLGPYGNLGLFVVAAFVLGSVFFRQDPKKPDFKSARRIWRKADPDERKKLAVHPVGENEPELRQGDAQFPYLFIRDYLEARGLRHLARWIPWKGSDPSTWSYRTKMYINILKIRLQYVVPDKCKEIVRNEANVRMATSVWYATKWIIWTVSGSIALLLAGMAVFHIPFKSLTLPVGYDVIVFIFSFALQRNIEKFLHYLRVREIVYVLEAVDFAVRRGEEFFIEDFFPKGIDLPRSVQARSTDRISTGPAAPAPSPSLTAAP